MKGNEQMEPCDTERRGTCPAAPPPPPAGSAPPRAVLNRTKITSNAKKTKTVNEEPIKSSILCSPCLNSYAGFRQFSPPETTSSVSSSSGICPKTRTCAPSGCASGDTARQKLPPTEISPTPFTGMGRVTVPIFPACRFGSPTDAASDEICVFPRKLRTNNRRSESRETQRTRLRRRPLQWPDRPRTAPSPPPPTRQGRKKQHEHGRHQLHGQQDYAQNKPHGGDRHGTLLLL